MMAEAEVLSDVLSYLRARGIYHWRNNSGYRGNVHFGKVGSADILGILEDGRLLAIEVKSMTGVATEDQLIFIAEICKRGGLAFIARSVDDVIGHLAR
jgi:hypothetical protein